MNFYDQYKPFRNFLRRFSQVDSLVDLWVYSSYCMEGLPLPRNYAVLKDGRQVRQLSLFPWDFDVLTREVILNGSELRAERSLKQWNEIAKATNFLRDLDEAAFLSAGGRIDILFYLHRIAHRQFPWQTEVGPTPLLRALKIYGESSVEAVIQRELGMTIVQFIQLGMAVRGHFQRSPEMSLNQDYSQVLGISKASSDAYLKRMSCRLKDLRVETQKQQRYDENWINTWNPLEAWPLVQFDDRHPDRVICPLPRFLARRSSVGIFYDLVNVAGFQNPYGGAFQTFIGEVIRKTCPPPRFTALEEKQYGPKSKRKHGVDWVLSDASGHLFIETKTKRLTLNARGCGDLAALERDLAAMADAIVQNYKNILDARDGLTQWKPDGKPIYPLILTLEDWFLISPTVVEQLRQLVLRFLLQERIPESVLDDMPYTIASSHEFELTSQVINQVGIATVMHEKTSLENRSWCLLPFVQGAFKDAMKQVDGRLFPEDFQRLLVNPPKPNRP
jgi:hypothetical protein